MTRVPSFLVLLLVASVAGLAAGASSGDAASPPTRLYYNITLKYTGDEHYTTTQVTRDETGILDQRTSLSHSGSLDWTAKTNESVLLRRLPDGRVTFVSSGGATVAFAFKEHGVTGQMGYQRGWFSTPPCEQAYRGEVKIVTTGAFSLGTGARPPSMTLTASVNAPKSEITTKEATCVAQRNEDDAPFVKRVHGERFENMPRAHLSGLPGLGQAVEVALGNNLALNFGRSAITARYHTEKRLDAVHERDYRGLPTSFVLGRAVATAVVTFERCPKPRPCR